MKPFERINVNMSVWLTEPCVGLTNNVGGDVGADIAAFSTSKVDQ